MLNSELYLFGNFLDEVFGDGVAEQLLGNNPSITKIIEVNDAPGVAIQAQGNEFGEKLKKYTPNRATPDKATKNGRLINGRAARSVQTHTNISRFPQHDTG